MANSKLRGKMFPVPYRVLSALNKNLKKFSDKRENKGFNRSLFILNRKACSYEQLKRIKNYFDTITDDNYDEIEYALNGGDIMKNWVNQTLDFARNDVKSSKTIRRDAGLEDQFRKSDDFSIEKSSTSIRSIPDFMTNSDLKEEIDRIIKLIK